MTDTERVIVNEADLKKLVLKAHVAELDLLREIAKAVGAYHDGSAANLQEKIEAVLDSQTADEVDALK
jgi:hypothetical protein